MPDQRIADLLERLCEGVESLSKAISSAGTAPFAMDDDISREILTEEEVANLTGLKTRSRQAKWLRENGWVHALSAGGRPLIGRLYLQYRLGAPIAKPDRLNVRPKWQPDLSKIK